MDLSSADAAPPDAAPDDAGGADAADSEPDAGPPPQPCQGELALPAHSVDEPAAAFRRGPYLQSVGRDSAVVVWQDPALAPTPPAGDVGPSPAEDGGAEADAGAADAGAGDPVEGCVEYSQAGGPLQRACGLADGQGQVAVTLDGLTPDEPVTYWAVAGPLSSGPHTLSLAPPPTAATRLVVFGDAHANRETLRLLSRGALEGGVHAAVAVGDMVSQPTPDQWDAFFDGGRSLLQQVPFWPVLGNHEGYAESYFDAFVVPGAAPPPSPPEVYYSARWGDVWMGMLQLDELMIWGMFEGTVELAQVTWLQQALASPEATSARWRLLFLHQPAWARGWGHCDGYRGEDSLRAMVLPMLADLGVDAMFSGHVHGYERGEASGILLVTTGGAGGGLDMDCGAFDGLPDPWVFEYVHHYTLVDATCDRLIVEARALDGRVVDRVERAHRLAEPPEEGR